MSGRRRGSPPRRLESMVWASEAMRIERARAWLRDRLLQQVAGRSLRGRAGGTGARRPARISDTDWTLFNRTGISHLVSISGLHITMIAALVGGVVGAVAPQPRPVAARSGADWPRSAPAWWRRCSMRSGRLGNTGAAHGADAGDGRGRLDRARAGHAGASLLLAAFVVCLFDPGPLTRPDSGFLRRGGGHRLGRPGAPEPRPDRGRRFMLADGGAVRLPSRWHWYRRRP